MAFMSRATAYRRISHAVQANVRTILVAAGEGINAEENLSRVAFTSNQPEVPEPPLNCSLSQVESARGLYGGVQPEVPESPLNRSLGQVASAGIYGGVLESCDVEYHTGDSMHSVPVEPDNVPDGCHRCLTQQDTATDSNSMEENWDGAKGSGNVLYVMKMTRRMAARTTVKGINMSNQGHRHHLNGYQ
ncbi:hypothetical protein MTO96_025370 [Rhipicephalus appendiculatus]